MFTVPGIEGGEYAVKYKNKTYKLPKFKNLSLDQISAVDEATSSVRGFRALLDSAAPEFGAVFGAFTGAQAEAFIEDWTTDSGVSLGE